MVCRAAVLFGPSRAAGQTWTSVGSTGAQASKDIPSFSNVDLAFNNGVPYIAFADTSVTPPSANIRVMIYSASAGWSNVGFVGFGVSVYGSPAYWHAKNLAFNNGVPYIAFNPSYRPVGACVVAYGGHDWAVVGDYFTGPQVDWDVSLAFNNDVPYISFSDYPNHTIRVMAYSSGAWLDVGLTGAFAHSDVNIAFNNGVPYIAFADHSTDAARVMAYSGGTWSNVGLTGSKASWDVDLAFNNGVPYIAFADYNNDATRVMAYSGGTWSNVGSTGAKAYLFVNLAFNNGEPYIAFADNNSLARVMAYSGGTWSDVGSTGATAYSVSLAFDNGVPFIAFVETNGTNTVRAMSYSLPQAPRAQASSARVGAIVGGIIGGLALVSCIHMLCKGVCIAHSRRVVCYSCSFSWSNGGFDDSEAAALCTQRTQATRSQ